MDSSEHNPLSPALVGILRGDQASPAEVERAYRRLRSARYRRPRALAWLRPAAFGLCLGCGVAVAATAAYAPFSVPRTAPPRTAAPAAGSAPQRVGATTPIAAPPPVASVPEPLAESALETSVPAAHTLAVHPAVSVEDAPAPLPELAATATSLAWQRAAAGLRDKDLPRARGALLELVRTTSGAERDAARLALAQVMLNAGETADATRLLADLSEHGASLTIRDKAAALLGGAKKIGAVDRSTGP